MAATLKDVAKLAQVDIGSVSRTLSDHPRAQKLRQETRMRIFDAARKLGYKRNEAAVAMRTGINRIVAVINSGKPVIFRSPSATLVTCGILDAAGRCNYALKVYTDEDLPGCIEQILAAQIKYVISLSPDNAKREETASYCRRNGLKLVFVYETAHGEFPAVTYDNFNTAKNVVNYLTKMGHRRIALVCGEYRQFHYMWERYNGYLAGLRDAGLEPEFKMMICKTDIEEDVDEMLSRPAEERPTAFFCIGDGLAMQIQRAAIRKGLRVPEDISVTGFGNMDYGLNALAPITSAAEPFELMGFNAFELLLHGSIDFQKDEDGTYRIPCTFLERESVVKIEL